MLNKTLDTLNANPPRVLPFISVIAVAAVFLAGCGRESKTPLEVATASELPSSFEFPLVHPQETSPNGRRMLTLDSTKGTLQIAEIDGSTVTRTSVVKVGMQPVSVRAVSNREAWVVDPIADSISVVDLESATVVATLQTAPQPTDVLFSGSPSRAYVTVAHGSALLVFDPVTRGEPLTQIALRLAPGQGEGDDG